MPRLTIDSPIGKLTVSSDKGALTALDWGGDQDDEDTLLQEAARQLRAYFDGTLLRFRLPLTPGGSRFQQKVWQAMQTIPYGGVASYGDVADQIGSAPRAIGLACARNPLPVIIPCHRVLGSDGAIGGYSGAGGTRTKRWLLRHEARPAK